MKEAIDFLGNNFIQLKGVGFTCTLEKIVKLKLIGAKFQGRLYGELIEFSQPFNGLFRFLNWAKSNNHSLLLISHKSTFPAIGKVFNLHARARDWLEKNGIREYISDACSFFYPLSDKVECIAKNNCDFFIVDLSSVLEHPNFPQSTQGILFGSESDHLESCYNWHAVVKYFQQPSIEKKEKEVAAIVANQDFKFFICEI